jgi:hypothetical protein
MKAAMAHTPIHQTREMVSELSSTNGLRPSYPQKPHDEHGIAWTEKTWNPMHGCTKCSLGCQNCYACSMAKRQQGMGKRSSKNGAAHG